MCEDLRRQLEQANRSAENANRLCEGLQRQLDDRERHRSRDDNNNNAQLVKELRAKLERARAERASYKASAQKLQDVLAKMDVVDDYVETDEDDPLYCPKGQTGIDSLIPPHTRNDHDVSPPRCKKARVQ